CCQLPGLNRATAREPYGWMRFLDRFGPRIHVAHLGVLAVPDKRPGPGPGGNDEIVSLSEASASFGRNYSVYVIYVHRGADRPSGNQAATAQTVDLSHLLRHSQR